MPLVSLSYKTECYMSALLDLTDDEIERMKSGTLWGSDEDLIKKVVDYSEFDYIIPSMVDMEEIEATALIGNWPFTFKEVQLIPKADKQK